MAGSLENGTDDETRAARLPAFFHLVALDSCGSTNDEAKSLARAGAPEGTLVWALRQTGGRGRRGRTWASPPGNLYCSLVLRPALPPAEAAQLSFVASIAVAEAVSALIPGRAQLKWPNDVLVDGAKISGMLLESEAGRGDRVDWLVLGVGINVSHHPTGLPYAATCLAEAGAGEAGVETVLRHYADAFVRWYQRFLAQGFAPVRAAWLNAAHGLGGPITVRLQEDALTGRFVDLDADGGLLVETPEGVRRITAGDVFFA